MIIILKHNNLNNFIPHFLFIPCLSLYIYIQMLLIKKGHISNKLTSDWYGTNLSCHFCNWYK